MSPLDRAIEAGFDIHFNASRVSLLFALGAFKHGNAHRLVLYISAIQKDDNA